MWADFLKIAILTFFAMVFFFTYKIHEKYRFDMTDR